MFHEGFANCLSQDCHIGIDRNVSTACCRSSIIRGDHGDSVDLLSRTICSTMVVASDWCIMNLAHGWLLYFCCSRFS